VCLGLAATLVAPSRAAVLIQVKSVPDSSSTRVFGINDKDIIVGSYVGSTDGVEHGFYGTLAGDYTSFDAGGGGTEARGINNQGYITGFSNSQQGNWSTWPIFEREPNGKIENVTHNAQQLYGLTQGINSQNRFVGAYWNTASDATEGFVGKRGLYLHDLYLYTEQQADAAYAINDTGVIGGAYFPPPEHRFIVSDKTLTKIDYPGSNVAQTVVEGINNKGLAVGQWIDTSGGTHSFLYDIAAATFTDIKIKGARGAIWAWGINNAGAVAVSTDASSYIWCLKRRDCPSGGTGVDAPVHAAENLGYP
jgi:hypothetical protein